VAFGCRSRELRGCTGVLLLSGRGFAMGSRWGRAEDEKGRKCGNNDGQNDEEHSGFGPAGGVVGIEFDLFHDSWMRLRGPLIESFAGQHIFSTRVGVRRRCVFVLTLCWNGRCTTAGRWL
jgi:hypothetical protein